MGAETEFEIITHLLVVDCRLTFPPQDNSNSDKTVQDAMAITRIEARFSSQADLNKPTWLNS